MMETMEVEHHSTIRDLFNQFVGDPLVERAIEHLITPQNSPIIGSSLYEIGVAV
jgi:hypothetical protein